MNSRELVLVLGMVTVLVVCREKDSQVFPFVQGTNSFWG